MCDKCVIDDSIQKISVDSHDFDVCDACNSEYFTKNDIKRYDDEDNRCVYRYNAVFMKDMFENQSERLLNLTFKVNVIRFSIKSSENKSKRRKKRIQKPNKTKK